MSQKEGIDVYTKDELKRVETVITCIAKQHGLPEESIRDEIQKAISASRNNCDPSIQNQWSDSEFSMRDPTPEEFILWLSDKTKLALWS